MWQTEVAPGSFSIWLMWHVLSADFSPRRCASCGWSFAERNGDWDSRERERGVFKNWPN
jgi:hypothetical protein